MNHESSFAVSRYENRNGVISWRVAGWLHGVRIRKNFKAREEAAAEKAALEMKAEQATSGLHTVTTCLSTDQVRQAEAVFRSLEGRPGSLAFYVNYALTNYRDPVQDMPLARAIAAYLMSAKKAPTRSPRAKTSAGSLRSWWQLKRAGVDTAD